MGDEDIGIEGPRTIRYFRALLLIVTMVFVLGVVLNIGYDFPWLERGTRPFLENPMSLLKIAGILAFLMLLYLGWRFIEDQTGHTRRR